MTSKDKSREKLGKELAEEITGLFEQSLDYVQVACPTKDTYKVLRSKILRAGNDCIRNAAKIIQHYEIEYVPQAEDIIEVKPQIIRK